VRQVEVLICSLELFYRTLYCAKGNYEFGLSRIAHSLEGGTSGTRLCADTWLHVKRCVLGLLTGLSKQTIVLPSIAIQDILNFLQSCESESLLKSALGEVILKQNSFISVYGLTIPSVLPDPLDEANEQPPTIGMEARKLRALLLRLVEYY
jgi:tetratricopeptide repeat protein 30